MSFSPLDSDLLGPLFTTEAMRDCFADRSWIASMLAVEAALARSENQLGLAPDALGLVGHAIRTRVERRMVASTETWFAVTQDAHSRASRRSFP